MRMDPRNPALYDTLIAQEEDTLLDLSQQMELVRHRIEQLKGMKSLATEYAGTSAPVLRSRPSITVQQPPKGRRQLPPHQYDEDGLIIIPKLKRSTPGRPPAQDRQLVITNFLREKGVSMADIARNKAGFGGTLKRTADAAGRSYTKEAVLTASFDHDTKEVERVVWREADRDLFEYVFNRSFSHLLP